MRGIVEAMRILWTQSEASYEGEVRFPAVRCEPKPVQKLSAGVAWRAWTKALSALRVRTTAGSRSCRTCRDFQKMVTLRKHNKGLNPMRCK
jgi:hypothetical protein